MDIPPFTLTLGGPAGMGKTHLALTLSEIMPVHVEDTEYRVEYLIRKTPSFSEPKHPITVTHSGSWADFRKNLGMAAKKASEEGQHVAVIIDSASDFKNYAKEEWEKSHKTFPITNWHTLYLMMDRVIKGLKSHGCSVVMTSRDKKVYTDDKWDGKSYELDLYKNQAFLSDAMLQFDVEGNLHVLKNYWSDMREWSKQTISRDDSLHSIIKALMGI